MAATVRITQRVTVPNTELVFRASNDLSIFGRLSYKTLQNVQQKQSLDGNPIFAILHEPIYCQGCVSAISIYPLMLVQRFSHRRYQSCPTMGRCPRRRPRCTVLMVACEDIGRDRTDILLRRNGEFYLRAWHSTHLKIRDILITERC